MRALPPLSFVGIALACGAFCACGGPAATRAPDDGDASNHAADGGDEGGGVTTEDGGEVDGATDAAAGPGDGSVNAGGATDANGPPFPCGASMTCYEITQFCSHVTGPHGGDFYDCNEPPAACAGELSCACLATQGVVSPCVEEDGGITVTATE